MWSRPTGEGTFAPIRQLNRTDAQVSLLFLEQSQIRYLQPTNDPWFAATTSAGNRFDTPVYSTDNTATILGCASQTQYCNPDMSAPSQCVNLAEPDYKSYLESMWPEERDRAAMLGFAIALALTKTPIDFYADYIPSLKAALTLSKFQTLKLPQNQWQLEMEFTFQASLASIQASLVDTVRGKFMLGRGACEEGTDCRAICGNLVCYSSWRPYSYRADAH